VCKPRKDASLGIKDLRLVNASLLAKWRWKLLSPNEEVWMAVIKAKYGGNVIGNVHPGIEMVPRRSSKWWVDICNIDKGSDWFMRSVMKKVGNGRFTKFWTDIWVGDQALKVLFPRLFNISNQQEELVFNMGSLVENQWRWDLQWRISFFDWEETLRRQLEEVIDLFHPLEHEDYWQWRGNGDEGFTVKSCYDRLCVDSSVGVAADPLVGFVFSNIWKCAAPSKVCAFSWQLLLNRIATKDNLWKRRMLGDDQTRCVHCVTETETAVHLFLHCRCAAKVWYATLQWLGFTIVAPPNLSTSFAVFVGHGRDKLSRKALILIWNTIMWVMWKNRNDGVFNEKQANIEDMVDEIKLLSWKWFLSGMAKGPCLLYEWKWSPLDCFHR
jgi:hypothetical protein